MGSERDKRRKKPTKRAVKAPETVDEQVEWILRSLKRLGSKRNRQGMARYALPSVNTFGVPMSKMQGMARSLGRNHDLALALWATGFYEARILASFVDEPERVTPRQMDEWCRDFDNWGTCDTVCFHLFDRTPHAYRKVIQWSRKKAEFERRAAFALLACLALHDKKTDDEPFIHALSLIEEAANDERNFVKKGVSWALRLIGRRNLDLNTSSVALSARLMKSEQASARWIGRDAFKELTSPAVVGKLKSKKQR